MIERGMSKQEVNTPPNLWFALAAATMLPQPCGIDTFHLCYKQNDNQLFLQQ